MENNKMIGKEYIGDGVYVRHDGQGGVWLTTEDGYKTTNKIYLEDSVYYALRQYWEKCYEKSEEI
jgi:hypothetical protein